MNDKTVTVTATEPIFNIVHVWNYKEIATARKIEIQLTLTGWRNIKLTGA